MASPSPALNKKRLMREIDRDQKKAARAKVAGLRVQVRDTKRQRREAIAEAKQRCRKERLAARERARALRIRGLADLKAAAEEERAAARRTCSVRIDEARAIKNNIERARAELAAEEDYQRDLRRIESSNRKRRREHPHASYIERRSESDDEVISNLSPELVPVFEKMKRSIKASPRMSRLEVFLKWVEEHPSELFGALEAKTDELVRELEREQRRASRPPVRRARSRVVPRADRSAEAVPF